MTDYYETKAHPITKRMVWEAYKEIRSNGKAAGIDGINLADYAKDLQHNLYKLWNRMTSGSYFPSSIREKQIPKSGGGTRGLGISTVEDRIAQQVVKKHLEHRIDPTFHESSYGYRPQRNPHQAIRKATSNCIKYSWVLDLDIKAFFDSVDHHLLMKAVRRYTEEKGVLLYIERWLKVRILKEDGIEVARNEGTPQGSVLSPLLSNLFMHFVFDKWMEKHYPTIPFERFCDDVIVHCRSEKQALYLKSKIANRLRDCNLTLNEQKTKIVFCKNPNNKGVKGYEHESFDFLGFSYQPMQVPTKNGILLLTLPTMSRKSKKSVMEKIRKMAIYNQRGRIQELASKINERTRGWINYYGAFNKNGTTQIWYRLNRILIKWIMKVRKWNFRRSLKWLKGVHKTRPRLFVHWEIAHP